MPAPGVTLDRRNLCVIETQVQPAYQFPKGTRTVVLVDQLLNIDGAQQDLPAINGNQSRTWRRRMVAHTCSVRTFVDSAIVLWRPSVDFFTASRRDVPGLIRLSTFAVRAASSFALFEGCAPRMMGSCARPIVRSVWFPTLAQRTRKNGAHTVGWCR